MFQDNDYRLSQYVLLHSSSFEKKVQKSILLKFLTLQHVFIVRLNLFSTPSIIVENVSKTRIEVFWNTFPQLYC